MNHDSFTNLSLAQGTVEVQALMGQVFVTFDNERNTVSLALTVEESNRFRMALDLAESVLS